MSKLFYLIFVVYAGVIAVLFLHLIVPVIISMDAGLGQKVALPTPVSFNDTIDVFISSHTMTLIHAGVLALSLIAAYIATLLTTRLISRLVTDGQMRAKARRDWAAYKVVVNTLAKRTSWGRGG